jgi:hypothetical protein
MENVELAIMKRSLKGIENVEMVNLMEVLLDLIQLDGQAFALIGFV